MLLAAVLALAGCGGNQDANVAHDLVRVLDQHDIAHGTVSCAHQNGSAYICVVNTPAGQRTAAVTDDGHTIVEQGIAP